MTVLFGAGEMVKVTSPAHQAKVNGTIEIVAQITTSEPVSYAVLAVDDTRPASKNSDPWTFSLDTRELTDGPHLISVEVFDSQGLIAASKAITINVKNAVTKPVIKAKSPSTPAPTAVTTAPKTTVATLPALQEPARAAATSSLSPIIIAAVAETATDASVAAAMTLPGPTPEPVHTTTVTTVTPRDSQAAAVTTSPVATTTPNVVTPPMVQSAPALASHWTPVILVNGQPLQTEVKPILINGRLHTGLRALFESMGAYVDWDATTRTARCEMDNLVVEVPIGSRIATVNGRPVDMGTVATTKNGRTVVPLQFFAQVTGASLSWDEHTRTASLQTTAHTLASVPASSLASANTPTTIVDSASVSTPIHELAERAP
jgi:hypothetical protein